MRLVQRILLMSSSLNISTASCSAKKCNVLTKDDDDDVEPPVKKAKRYIDPRPTPKSLCKPLEVPTFYIENVRPYWFQYATGVKGRWQGRNIIEVFQTEIHHRSPDYFKDQIRLGRMKVNFKPTTENYKLWGNDIITNVTHRHELPVLDKPIIFIENNDDVVVVDKPCSLPVHPCGRYCFNCLTTWLELDHGIKNLKLVHRLDRLTSGVVILSKNPEVDLRLKRELIEHKVKKEYLARVVGEFPEGDIVCEKPIESFIHSMGIQRVSSNESAKMCKTKFQLVHFNGVSSVVRCLPLTGRTHQIRVHLQYLGHPIVNDYIYNSTAWGSQKGKLGEYGMPLDELTCNLKKALGAHNWIVDFNESIQDFIDSKNVHLLQDGEKQQTSTSSSSSLSATSSEKSNLPVETIEGLDGNSYPVYDPLCPDCHLTSREPTEKDLQMYLHCLKYEGPNWSYSTELPDWAKPEWKESE